MSRIGKLPITVPEGVEVKVSRANIITISGPKGELKQEIEKDIKVKNKDGVITVTRPSDNKKHRALHGLSRALLNNMVVGVTTGFEKKLEVVGVGYRIEKKGSTLVLNIGYSHSVEMEDPEGVVTEVVGNNGILVKGIDKAEVGNHAANIRAKRPPEPYKGKGIKYADEHIVRKEGKTGA